MNEVIFSVIMPTYNRGYILENAIQSVLSQTLKAWELIIVDDGSIDNTADVVKKYTDERIHYYKNDINRGQSFSSNKAAKLAKGEYLAFIDSDNIWDSRKLELQYEDIIANSKNVGIFLCRIKQMGENIEYLVPPEEYDINKLERDLIISNRIDTNAIVVKKDLFLKVGGFDENIVLQDWDFLINIITINKVPYFFRDDILVTNIWQENSLSFQNDKKIKSRMNILLKYADLYPENELIIAVKQGVKYCKVEEIEEVFREIKEIYGENDFLKFLADYVELRYEEEELTYTYFLRNINLLRNTLHEFFSDKKVALYGIGQRGERFYKECQELGIHFDFCIDNVCRDFHGLNVVHIDSMNKNIDYIFVSVKSDAELIKCNLESITNAKVYTISDFYRNALMHTFL